VLHRQHRLVFCPTPVRLAAFGPFAFHGSCDLHGLGGRPLCSRCRARDRGL